MIYIKTIKESQNAEEVWQNYWDIVWKLYELSKEIRTDREIIFTSKKWNELFKKNEIQYYKTIIYCLQINELVKRINQEIKKYLRKFVNHE